jgi:hypothetical protein
VIIRLLGQGHQWSRSADGGVERGHAPQGAVRLSGWQMPIDIRLVYHGQSLVRCTRGLGRAGTPAESVGMAHPPPVPPRLSAQDGSRRRRPGLPSTKAASNASKSGFDRPVRVPYRLAAVAAQSGDRAPLGGVPCATAGRRWAQTLPPDRLPPRRAVLRSSPDLEPAAGSPSGPRHRRADFFLSAPIFAGVAARGAAGAATHEPRPTAAGHSQPRCGAPFFFATRGAAPSRPRPWAGSRGPSSASFHARPGHPAAPGEQAAVRHCVPVAGRPPLRAAAL